MTTPATFLADAVQGATLRLQPGSYRDIRLNGVSGLTIIGGPGVTAANWRLVDCEGLDISGIAFTGDMDQDTGMALIRCSGSVHGNTFSRLFNCLTHTDSHDLTVEDNDFHDIRQDAVHGSGVKRMLVKNNRVWRFFRTENKAGTDQLHPDAFQFWGGSDSVTIRRNRVIRDLPDAPPEGSVMHGVFFNDATNTGLRHTNVVIEDNRIIGCSLHGIGLCAVDGAKVRRNVITGLPETPGAKGFVNSGIVEQDCTGVSYARNKAQVFTKDGDRAFPPGVAQIAMPTDGGAALLGRRLLAGKGRI